MNSNVKITIHKNQSKKFCCEHQFETKLGVVAKFTCTSESREALAEVTKAFIGALNAIDPPAAHETPRRIIKEMERTPAA